MKSYLYNPAFPATIHTRNNGRERQFFILDRPTAGAAAYRILLDHAGQAAANDYSMRFTERCFEHRPMDRPWEITEEEVATALALIRQKQTA